MLVSLVKGVRTSTHRRRECMTIQRVCKYHYPYQSADNEDNHADDKKNFAHIFFIPVLDEMYIRL